MRSSSGPLSRRLWRRRSASPHRHRSPTPANPHGQGFVAATSMNRVGNTSARWPRTIVTHPSSSGCLKRVEARTLELGKLVEKQDAMVGQRRLAGPGWRPAAHQPGGRDRVVRSPERPRLHEPAGVQPGDAVDPRHLDRLGPAHRGQDRRDPPGEHRLARSRRALEQEVVAAGGRDLERQQGSGVAPDIGQVGLDRRGGGDRAAGSRRQRRGRAAREDLCGGPQGRHSGDLEPLDERGLAGALARDDQTLEPGAACALGDRQGPRRVAQVAAQRQLAEYRVGTQRVRRNLLARREHAERERRVEPRPDLAQERRREVRGDPSLGELEARVGDRRADPVARLPHRRVPEADDRERGQAAADVDLDPDVTRIDPVDRECGDAREHRVQRTRRRVNGG